MYRHVTYKMWPVHKIKNIKVRAHNAEGSPRVDLSTRLAIIGLVVELIDRPPRRSIIAGSWMRSRGVNLGLTGRGRGRGAQNFGDAAERLTAWECSLLISTHGPQFIGRKQQCKG